MNQVNFNSFKNIHASDELIQRTIAAAEASEKAPSAIPHRRRTKVLATAASVALVVLAGLSVYFFFGNKTIPVKPSEPITQTETESITEATVSGSEPATRPGTETATAAPTAQPQTNSASQPTRQPQTNSASQPTRQPQTNSVSQPQTQPGGTVVVPDPERPSEARVPDPTAAAPTQGSPIRPRPTEKPAVTPTEKPAERPTKPSATDAPDPTSPPEPTIKPQKDPTIHEPTQAPTDEPWDMTDAPTEPTEPTESTESDPTPTLRAAIRADNTLFHGTVYCRIYDRTAKKVLGDPDPYAASHLAAWEIENNKLYIVYIPSEHGIELAPGSYAVAFRNEYGENLYRGYITI